MSEGNVPEPDPSLEMQQVEDTISSHPDKPPTEADSSGDNPMEVDDDTIKEQPEKLDSLQDTKEKSPAKRVIKSKSSPSKLGIKLTSPSKSPVKTTSPIRGKRQSPSKPPQDVCSPSKKQSLDVITSDQITIMEVSSSSEFVAEKIKSPIKRKRESPSKPPQDVHSPSKKQSPYVITTDQRTMETHISIELVEENSDSSSSASKISGEVGKNSEVSQASPDPSNTSNVGIAGVSQTSSDSSDPSNVGIAEVSKTSSDPSDPSNVGIAGVSKTSSDPSDPSHIGIAGVSQASSDPSDPSHVGIAGVSQVSSDPSDPSHVGIAGVSQVSSDPSDPSHVGIAGVSQASSDPSDPSHVCVETCIHGGARPKTRVLTTVHRSSEQTESPRILEQMNRYAERMERRFAQNQECFGNENQQNWTIKIDSANFFAEELASEMGHGPFVHSGSSNTEYPSILQLQRMFTGLSLEHRNTPETGTPQIMDTDQEPHPSQSFFQQEPTIRIDQVPESRRPMDVDEVLSSSFPGWQAPEPEPEPVIQMDQVPPNEEVKAAEPQEEPQQPRQEYRLMRLAMRVPQIGPFIINPNHPYRQRNENIWRTSMMTAYRSERYHSNELLHDVMSQLERDGVSQEDFFHFYPSARRIDLFRDEGVEEMRLEPEREEITIEDKINRIIIAVGFMTVAMLYIRLYIARHPEIETSSESSTMDSGNIDRSESEPKTDYARLREHVNVDLGSSDNTDSPKGIGSPGNNSPQEIQSPDFIPIPNRGSPVNVLVPLSQVPKRSDSPSSQGSLLVESDPSGSSSSKKGLTLHRAVLGKCHAHSLDNTSGDASPIQPDEEEPREERTFGQLINICFQLAFSEAASEIMSREVEDSAESVNDKEKKDSGLDVKTGEAPSDQDRDTEGVVEDLQNDGTGAKETSLTEEKKDQSADVSMMESTSDEKGEIECAEHERETDDDSKTDDLGASKSGKKRKENSSDEDERHAKRGKEY